MSWSEMSLKERLEVKIKQLKKDFNMLNTPELYKHEYIRRQLGDLSSTIFMLETILSPTKLNTFPWKEKELDV